MAFREYKIGVRLFGIAFGSSMFITLYLPSMDISHVQTTQRGLERELSFGRVGGFSYEDPFLTGKAKPTTVTLTKDPKTGAAIESTTAYVYESADPFPSGIRHPRILGKAPEELSLSKGRIGEASQDTGAVFIIRDDNGTPYVEDVTATRGWTPSATLRTAGDANSAHVGSGKIMFVREGCWWCHTLLPEETQDWQYFGAPPMLGDFNGESPTAFGSDRKAPDLTHVASRNSSKQWMMLHFFNPRLVQPHSIMPRYDYLWGDKDVNGKTIDYSAWRTSYNEYIDGKTSRPPEVPQFAPNSDIRYLIDFVLALK